VYEGCNHAFGKAAGIDDPETIVGLTDYDLPWKKEEADFFIECDQRVMSSGIPELDIEEPQKQADGRDRYLQTSKVPLRDESGEVVGILGIFADITERKQMELELRQKNREIAAMLNSMQQGVFTVDANLTIQPQYSAHLEHLLGSKDIAGRDCLQTVFAGSSVQPDALQAMHAALLFTIGSDSFFAASNAAHLVSEFHRVNEQGEQRYFEVDWNPIVDETDTVQQILVTLRDVSLLKQLKETVAANGRELAMLGQVLDAGIEPFERFSSSARALLGEVESLLGRAATPGAEVLKVCFRNMHTIKGNARLLGLGELVGVAHRAEQPYAEAGRDGAKLPDRAELAANIDPIRATIDDYEKVYQLKVGNVARASGVRAEQALHELRALLNNADSATPAQTLRGVERILSTAEAVPLDELVKESARMLPSLASELNKDAPSVTCEARGLLLTPAWAEIMRGVLAHAFRNALDHGLESREERGTSGKPASGKINLRVERLDKKLEIRMADDGQGLWLSALRERTSAADATDEEVADSVFLFGLSTAATVSETSGRGVGMSAIRSFVSQHGGQARIAFTGEASGGRRPFELIVELPGHAALSGAGAAG